MFRHLAAAAVLVGLASIVQAQQPRQPQRNPYDITPEAGPWAICVTSFATQIDRPEGRDFYPGELEQILAHTDARDRSVRFVSELRSDPYRLRAYLFNHGDDERKKEEERVAQERRDRKEFLLKHPELAGTMRPMVNIKRTAHIVDQYIVLIGGYRDRDDARRGLDGLRKLKPPSREFMNLVAGAQGSANMNALVNPFSTAFVVPNPTNPDKLKPPPREENELAINNEELNRNNPFSPLVAHQKKWTLIIKEYKIPIPIIGRNEQAQRLDPAKTGQTYEALGKQAEALAGLLRNKAFGNAFDTYVIHSKFASYVTVGIFDGPNDPRLASMQATLSKLSLRGPTGQAMVDLMNPAMPFPIPPLKQDPLAGR
jgi:hypothetical protein